MAGARAKWWQRLSMKYLPFLYKRGPCGNIHSRFDRYCYCRRGEHVDGFHGGVYDFKLKCEVMMHDVRSTLYGKRK